MEKPPPAEAPIHDLARASVGAPPTRSALGMASGLHRLEELLLLVEAEQLASASCGTLSRLVAA